ncbi:MAG: ATP-dependent 6-phosphofructokinase [Deltaproteobacteria bacterium]|nr:ATP-dependent 6-phosphofructokinase [Deltaproteobacteria bacterium]
MSRRKQVKRIGVLTGGGDAPGLNPAIRSLVFRAADDDIEVVGIYDGWEGLLDGYVEHTWMLDPHVVRTWDRDGGTNLGSSRTNPFRHKHGEKRVDRSGEVLRNIEKLGLDGLVAIGGEDTLGVARKLHGLGAPVVGIPKTIDKDLSATDYTLGFDTSVRTVAEIIERSRTPAGSHHWVQVVEVMGRHAGHLAFWSGLAGGAFQILIPEYPFQLKEIYTQLSRWLSLGHKDRRYPRYAVIVVSEGALPKGGHEVTVDSAKDEFGHARLGGIGAWLAERIRSDTAHDSRSVALGHPQRGGPPSPVDRHMGWLFGIAAVEAAIQNEWGKMVSSRGIAPACDLSLVSLADAVQKLSLLDVERYYDTERHAPKRRVLGMGDEVRITP